MLTYYRPQRLVLRSHFADKQQARGRVTSHPFPSQSPGLVLPNRRGWRLVPPLGESRSTRSPGVAGKGRFSSTPSKNLRGGRPAQTVAVRSYDWSPPKIGFQALFRLPGEEFKIRGSRCLLAETPNPPKQPYQQKQQGPGGGESI